MQELNENVVLNIQHKFSCKVAQHILSYFREYLAKSTELCCRDLNENRTQRRKISKNCNFYFGHEGMSVGASETQTAF